MKVSIENFDYIMFVDASGDDGFKFDKGSSTCYSAAAFLVKQEDIPADVDVLRQIKDIVGCDEKDEIKYSRIRRNRHGAQALRLMRKLHGYMSFDVIFKKEFRPEDVPGRNNKGMSSICHAMALRALDSFDFIDGKNVLIVIDRMKYTEEALLQYLVAENAINGKGFQEHSFSFKIIFRDSKDSNFLLLQIADLLCGTVREHFEQYETNEDMIYFKSICPLCNRIRLIKGPGSRHVCKNGKSRAVRIVHSKNLHNVMHLIPSFTPPKAFQYFFMDPKHMMYEHLYFVCERK